MTLSEIKKMMPNVKYKQMIYKTERNLEILCEGTYKDYHFYIMSLGTHPTAYIEIPKTNNLFGKSYDEIYDIGIDIDVHGGLTYSNDTLLCDEKRAWFIGWDYAHAGDYFGYSKLYPNLEEWSVYDKKWTTEEIFEDVVRAIEQIKEEEEN